MWRGRFAARVQKVQKVHRVQRGWYRPLGDEYIGCSAAVVGGFKIIKPPLMIKPLQPT